MSWLFHSIARVFLISCVFKNAFADSDLFSDFSLLDYQDTQLGDNLFFSADPPEIYEETVSSEDLFGNDGISADHQEVALTEDLFNVQISSSCSEVRQFGRVRTRDAMCPPVPELPLDGDDGDDDDLSDFMTPRRTGPEPTDVDENGVGVMRDPDYYCHKYAAPGYKLAVCGSGILIDIDHYVGPFYSQIRFSRLSTSCLSCLLTRNRFQVLTEN
jgi:hypothetical protein